ncbi:hypothetical protein DL98DRAFT_149020 [Cadophora sp. DSE1049]|nr:hypothetical protein DL98DRAFT_149020 [Cadophora sp. DSE1049]
MAKIPIQKLQWGNMRQPRVVTVATWMRCREPGPTPSNLIRLAHKVGILVGSDNLVWTPPRGEKESDNNHGPIAVLREGLNEWGITRQLAWLHSLRACSEHMTGCGILCLFVRPKITGGSICERTALKVLATTLWWTSSFLSWSGRILDLHYADIEPLRGPNLASRILSFLHGKANPLERLASTCSVPGQVLPWTLGNLRHRMRARIRRGASRSRSGPGTAVDI